jgi:sulfur-oxidizing protein SoxZ
MANARLLLPNSMASGDVVKARLLVEHPMHTGYLQDLQGRLIPRNVILRLTCDYGGREVFRVEPSSGVQAPGELLVRWVDDQGVAGQLRQAVNVQLPAARPAGT